MRYRLHFIVLSLSCLRCILLLENNKKFDFSLAKWFGFAGKLIALVLIFITLSKPVYLILTLISVATPNINHKGYSFSMKKCSLDR
jgi:hypothetical protein